MVSWTYDDNAGGPIADLDAVFREGNAPRFHGMLRSLADLTHTGDWWPPRYIDVPKIDVTGQNDGEITSGNFGDTSFGYDEYSILQGSARGDGKEDLTVEQFFYHADVLSGQDIGTVPEHANQIRDSLRLVSGGWIETALDRIQAARLDNSHPIWVDLVENFETAGGTVWPHWDDTAGQAAKERFADLHLWYGDRDPGGVYRGKGLGQLAQYLIGFAAAIHGARLSLDNLMGACVKDVHAWDESHEGPSTQMGWIAFSSIASAVTGTGLGVPLSIMGTVNSIANEISAQNSIASGGCYDILNNYLTEANGVLKQTAAAVRSLVDQMEHVRDDFDNARVPTW